MGAGLGSGDAGVSDVARCHTGSSGSPYAEHEQNPQVPAVEGWAHPGVRARADPGVLVVPRLRACGSPHGPAGTAEGLLQQRMSAEGVPSTTRAALRPTHGRRPDTVDEGPQP
jgi:hypothetical protein